MAWYLDNVRERNANYPYTFYIPSEDVINKLTIRDIVKLRFVGEIEEDDFGAEKMWVEITDRDVENFKGLLTNQPIQLKDLTIGQEIHFKAEHICDTDYTDHTLPQWNYYFDTKVIISNDVLIKSEINFMLRDHSRKDGDSGWTIFSGYESDEYVNDFNNLQIVSLGVVLNIDDSILTFIHDEPLCAYERNKNGQFYKIEDYDWDSYLNGQT